MTPPHAASCCRSPRSDCSCSPGSGRSGSCCSTGWAGGSTRSCARTTTACRPCSGSTRRWSGSTRRSSSPSPARPRRSGRPRDQFDANWVAFEEQFRDRGEQHHDPPGRGRTGRPAAGAEGRLPASAATRSSHCRAGRRERRRGVLRQAPATRGCSAGSRRSRTCPNEILRINQREHGAGPRRGPRDGPVGARRVRGRAWRSWRCWWSASGGICCAPSSARSRR